MYLARVYVKLKESVLDPQGQAVIHAMHEMSHTNVTDVRIGKYIEVKLNADSDSSAREKIETLCNELLANTVIETYSFDLEKI